MYYISYNYKLFGIQLIYRITYRYFLQIANMKQIVFLITLLTLALADKPAPEYKASASTLNTVGAKATAKVDTIAERQDTYGSPAAPAQDSYGSPAAPAKDSYGSPAAPEKDSYGSPAADPDSLAADISTAPIEFDISEAIVESAEDDNPTGIPLTEHLFNYESASIVFYTSLFSFSARCL